MPPPTRSKPCFCSGIREHARVGDDALLVRLEFRLECLTEADRLCGDDMLERAALCAGEDGLVKLLCQFLIVRQDDAAARTAQRLVRGGGDDIRVGNRTLVQTGSHQTGNVRHVNEQIRADLVVRFSANFSKSMGAAGTRDAPGDDHLRLLLFCKGTERIIVNETVLHPRRRVRYGTAGRTD